MRFKFSVPCKNPLAYVDDLHRWYDTHPRTKERRCERAAQVHPRKAQSGRIHRLQNRTRSVSVGGNMKEPMQEQSQASFFKLPTELKNIIYEMVLCETGCVYVQATDIPGDELKLESRVCKKPEGGSRPCYRTCFATKPWSARLLSLALVCQRMYRETINMLYSGNAFVFQTQMDFAIFSQSVLPQRLHSIRNMVMGSSILESHSPQLRDAYLQLSKGVNEFEILRSMESLKGVDYYMSCDLQQLDDAASSGSSTWAIYLSR